MPGGRPTDLTRAKIDKACACIAKGWTRTRTAASLGAGRQTWRDWYAKGARDEEGLYHEFHRRVTEALADQEAKLRDVIERCMDVDAEDYDANKMRVALQAAQWLLEHMFRDEWSLKQDDEVVALAKETVAATMAEFLERLGVAFGAVQLISGAEAYKIALEAAGGRHPVVTGDRAPGDAPADAKH